MSEPDRAAQDSTGYVPLRSHTRDSHDHLPKLVPIRSPPQTDEPAGARAAKSDAASRPAASVGQPTTVAKAEPARRGEAAARPGEASHAHHLARLWRPGRGDGQAAGPLRRAHKACSGICDAETLRVPPVVIAAITLAIVCGMVALALNFAVPDDAEARSSWRVEDADGNVAYAWDFAAFAAAVLAAAVVSAAVDTLLYTITRFLLLTRMYAVVLYARALHGPFGGLLFSVLGLPIAWHLTIPPFATTQARVVTLLTVGTLLAAAAELTAHAVQGRALLNAFHKSLRVAVRRLVVLQRLSVAAVVSGRAKAQVGAPNASTLRTGSAGPDTPNVSPVPSSSAVAVGAPVAVQGTAATNYDTIGRPPRGTTSLSQLAVELARAGTAPGNNAASPGRSFTPDYDRGSSVPNSARLMESSLSHEPDWHTLLRFTQRGRVRLYNADGSVVSVNSGEDIRQLADRLFQNLDASGAGYITMSDLTRGAPWPAWDEDEAQRAFRIMDVALAGRLRRRDFIAYAQRTLSDLRRVGATVHDYTGIANSFRLLLGALWFIIVLIVGLLLWEISLASVFIPLGTVMVSLSFALAGPAQNVLVALMFIMGTQPYSVGDRIRVNDGPALFVERIDVLSTSFRRLDGCTSIYANWILATSHIRNERRCPGAVCEFVFKIGHRTAPQQLDVLTSAIIHWVRGRQSSWQETVELYIYDVDLQAGAMTISFWLQHRRNLMSGATVWGSQSQFRMFFVDCCQRLGIEFIAAPMPVMLGSVESMTASFVRRAPEVQGGALGGSGGEGLPFAPQVSATGMAWTPAEWGLPNIRQEIGAKLSAFQPERFSHRYTDIRAGHVGHTWKETQPLYARAGQSAVLDKHGRLPSRDQRLAAFRRNKPGVVRRKSTYNPHNIWGGTASVGTQSVAGMGIPSVESVSGLKESTSAPLLHGEQLDDEAASGSDSDSAGLALSDTDTPANARRSSAQAMPVRFRGVPLRNTRHRRASEGATETSEPED